MHKSNDAMHIRHEKHDYYLYYHSPSPSAKMNNIHAEWSICSHFGYNTNDKMYNYIIYTILYSFFMQLALYAVEC